MRREPYALMLALVLGACSDDTGILVEVHGEQLQSSPARLDTLVYVDTGGGAPDSATWGTATPESATMGSIDLRTTPYSVMFRPDGVGDTATVYMSAVAYDGAGTIIGFGELGP